MRPLTFGVLVSVVSSDSSAEETTLQAEPNTPADPASGLTDRTLEGLTDLRSASDVATALRSLGFAAKPLAVDGDLDLTLRRADVDACILALHGRCGGLGNVQSLLTMRGVPFVGPSATSTALAFDKVRSRQVLAYHNLCVPAALAMGGNQKSSDKALELLGWPCIVKPRRGALGLGVQALMEPEQIGAAMHRALDFDEEIVLERAVSGMECQVVLLGQKVLGAVEIHQPSMLGGQGEPGRTEMVCPPNLSRGRLDGIYNIARRAASALGLHEGVTRVDIMVGDRYNEVVLEVEPLPPLHRDGVVARVAKAAGMAYEELISSLLDRMVLRAPAHESQRALLQ